MIWWMINVETPEPASLSVEESRLLIEVELKFCDVGDEPPWVARASNGGFNVYTGWPAKLTLRAHGPDAMSALILALEES